MARIMGISFRLAMFLLLIGTGSEACHRTVAKARNTSASVKNFGTAFAADSQSEIGITLIGSCIQRAKDKALRCKEYRYDPKSALGQVQTNEEFRILLASTCTASDPSLRANGFIAQWNPNRPCDRDNEVGECVEHNGTTVSYVFGKPKKAYIAALAACKLLHGKWQRSPRVHIDVDDASVNGEAEMVKGLRSLQTVRPKNPRGGNTDATIGSGVGACVTIFRGAPVYCEVNAKMPEMMIAAQKGICESRSYAKNLPDIKSVWRSDGTCPDHPTMGRCNYKIAGMAESTVYYSAWAGPFSGKTPSEAKDELEHKTCEQNYHGHWEPK